MTACITHNLKNIHDRIVAAATRTERDPSAVSIVAVTKTVGLMEILALYDLGVRDFGENRIESAQPKVEAAPDDIRWHFIAPIQSRKARDVVACFTFAEAVDRVKVANALQKRCEEQDRILDIMLEVNVSGEATKHGFHPDELPGALEAIRPFERLKIRGVMTMAPLGAPESVLRECFRHTKQLADEAGLAECSMGMSDDFEIAVEEGATQVRIGTALFV